MKYLILLTDGAGDEPIESLGNKTPLETAHMQYINELAHKGVVGMVNTIPEGIAPGSDAANLSVMGYDPKVYHTGRSPLEAASIGIEMADTDVAFRCNLVTLTGDGAYDDLTVLDHSSGDITTQEADVLMQAVNQAFGTDSIPVSYTHLPGAVVATAGILVVTWVYSFYITHFSNYDLLYGSLATIVGLLMWFYFMGFVLVIGIVFNAAWEETKHPRQD